MKSPDCQSKLVVSSAINSQVPIWEVKELQTSGIVPRYHQSQPDLVDPSTHLVG